MITNYIKLTIKISHHKLLSHKGLKIGPWSHLHCSHSQEATSLLLKLHMTSLSIWWKWGWVVTSELGYNYHVVSTFIIGAKLLSREAMFVHKRPYTEALVSSCAPNSNYGLSSLPWWTVSPGMLSQNKLSPFKLLLFRYLVTAKIDVCGVVSEGPCRRLFKGLL